MLLLTTSVGPVEYVEAGHGHPLLMLHGTPGGSDQALAAARVLEVEARVLAPSRPGYLGTPLSTGRTPSEQADAMIALLDELGVATVDEITSLAARSNRREDR